ncbi:PDR/VanB family oxidoreductase [Thalassospiraceae bacterium LMO-JJ14]|nr:PDR/VanB family oxidoreductase [Thalassospiraceae bacterium LMO-JJ14]
MTGSASLSVRVRSIVYQGDYINQYEVVHPDGDDLPPFNAGDHIDLYFRDGRVRQYSLCNDPKERSRYVFAVLRDENGRGGSKAIFDLVHVGRILSISAPRSNFRLAEGANKHLLLAGGIGITPIMSMVRHLEGAGADYELHYCTKSPEQTAFRDELRELGASGKVNVHHDGGVPSRGLNIAALLKNYAEGTHLYYCGPTGFMNAVKAASARWPKGTVHFELFKVPEGDSPVPDALMGDGGDGVIGVGFKLKLAKSGGEYVVPADKSIIEVLRENGVEVETSCEAGLCRTCITRVLEGEPEHMDYVLDEEEQREYMLICCSRSKSPRLVLDL